VQDWVGQVSFRYDVMKLRGNEKRGEDSVGTVYREVNMVVSAAAFIKSADSSLVI